MPKLLDLCHVDVIGGRSGGDGVVNGGGGLICLHAVEGDIIVTVSVGGKTLVVGVPYGETDTADILLSEGEALDQGKDAAVLGADVDPIIAAFAGGDIHIQTGKVVVEPIEVDRADPAHGTQVYGKDVCRTLGSRGEPSAIVVAVFGAPCKVPAIVGAEDAVGRIGRLIVVGGFCVAHYLDSGGGDSHAIGGAAPVSVFPIRQVSWHVVFHHRRGGKGGSGGILISGRCLHGDDIPVPRRRKSGGGDKGH